MKLDDLVIKPRYNCKTALNSHKSYDLLFFEEIEDIYMEIFGDIYWDIRRYYNPAKDYDLVWCILINLIVFLLFLAS